MPFTIEQLPAVNATLNALAAVLLILGWTLIKTRREQAHKWTMLTAFCVSCVFLTCYLVYHVQVGSVPFQGQGTIRAVYFSILITHVVLAATVPVLAGVTIYFGMADRREKHRRIARWTFPIWLYVSITGVIIYLMLYHLYPARAQEPIISGSQGVRAPSAATELN
jgi:uncharacterized membrane protein YozB (DUF420 family)